MKTCIKCGAEKPLTEYYRIAESNRSKSRDGHFGECKECNRARARAHMRQMRETDPDRAWQIRLKSVYGMTPDDYANLLAAQGGGCAICGSTDPGSTLRGKPRRFAIDHDHSCCSGDRTCGKCVRGLLCRGCNTGLGCLEEDVDRLMSAAAYLLARRDILAELM